MYKSSLTCYVLLHTPLGVHINKLLHLYRSIIRSKLGYGCIVCGSTRGSYLQILDPIWIMHSVYVLVLIEPLHPPACVYLQTNHLSTSGGESSPFNTA